MKENLIKFIIISLVTFFSVSMAYGNNDSISYSNAVSWIDKDGVIIGYKLDKFSPTKPIEKNDTIKNNIVIEPYLKFVIEGAVTALTFCFITIGSVFLFITLIGCIMLTIAIFVVDKEKNVN